MNVSFLGTFRECHSLLRFVGGPLRELAIQTGVERVESAAFPGKTHRLELTRFPFSSIAAKRSGFGGRAWWESVQRRKALP